MGSSNGGKNKKRSESFFTSIEDNVLKEIAKSVGKITIGKTSGTGFLVNLSKKEIKFTFLITNQNLIEEENKEAKKKIEFIYNNNKDKLELELDKDKRFIYNFKGDIGIDVTVVEILPDDKVSEDLFLKKENLQITVMSSKIKKYILCNFQMKKRKN